MTDELKNQRSAIEILESALSTFKERDGIYGSATVHYKELADLQNAFFFNERTPKDIVLGNVIEKLDRARRVDCDSETFKDCIEDAINYLAIAWEVS